MVGNQFYNRSFDGVSRFNVFDGANWHCVYCNKVLNGTGEICQSCASTPCENCGRPYIEHASIFGTDCPAAAGSGAAQTNYPGTGSDAGADRSQPPVANPSTGYPSQPVTYKVPCPKCYGARQYLGKCPNCNGSGRLTYGQGYDSGSEFGVSGDPRQFVCEQCNGSGYGTWPCQICGGQGFITQAL